MIYRAAAAYPYINSERATDALRGQLRMMALGGNGTPDWGTFAVVGPQPRRNWSTFLVKQRSGRYPRLAVDGSGRKLVSGAGGVLLTRTAKNPLRDQHSKMTKDPG